MNADPTTTRPRRWFRFRLRTLLILVTLLSLALGWVGWELDQRRKEQKVVTWILEMGRFEHFVFPYEPVQRSWWEQKTDKWFGEKVRQATFFDSPVADLSSLSELKNLEFPYLWTPNVTDLSPLADWNTSKCFTSLAQACAKSRFKSG